MTHVLCWKWIRGGFTFMTIDMDKLFKRGAVGRLMKLDFCSVQDHVTVHEAMMMIREYGKQTSNIHYLYMTNRKEQLTGVLSLKELLMASDNYLLRDIMIKDVVCIPGHLHQKEVAPLFDKNKLVAIPITTKHKHLLGVVQMNDIRKASTPKKRWSFFKKSCY